MIMEYELNREYIVDDGGEAIGETNFVVSASWLMANLETICPNVCLNTEQDIEDFLNWYEPEIDGEAIYRAAKLADEIVEEGVNMYD